MPSPSPHEAPVDHAASGRAVLLSCGAAALTGVRVWGGEATRDDDPKDGSALKAAVRFYTEVASRLDFRTQDRPTEPLRFQAEPVLVYSHPSGLQGTHGAFYIWTREGRPEVVGSIWSYLAQGGAKRTVVDEFDSLSVTPLVEMTLSNGVWSQSRVIEPRPIPDAPAVATTPRARATQIKQLASRFEGYSTTNETEVKLRMLTRPLYQFQSREGAACDCALYGLFADWDPEIMLLIESRQTPEGPRWHYSPARFNVCPMWLDHDKKRVWTVEKEPNTVNTFGDPKGPFFAVHDVASQPAELGKAAPGTPKR